jgi:hypothetical protein
VDDAWLHDIESLERITQDEPARTLFLRMAALQRVGAIPTFLLELDRDPDLDEDVKGPLAEIAQDADFLHALEEYCLKTERLH